MTTPPAELTPTTESTDADSSTATARNSDSATSLDADYALLFDMDGVVLEGWGTDPAVHRHALDDALESLNLGALEDPPLALETYEYTTEFVAACDEIGVEPSTFFATRERFSASRAIERLRAGERGLYPDVTALESLARNCELARVSNNYDPTVSFVVEHFDLKWFSFARGRDLGVEGFHRRKPKPDYLEEALDALEVSNGYYVGDRETDLLAAENAGLEPVFIRREHNAALEPNVERFHEIRTLDELEDVL